jgi:hypothetical protein
MGVETVRDAEPGAISARNANCHNSGRNEPMPLQLLESKESVQAACATINPVAREAAMLLAHRIFENPALANDGKGAFYECALSCAVSLGRAGVDVNAKPEVLDAFLLEFGHAVLNIGFSIVHVSIKEHQRRAAWGIAGKVAAAAVGIALGAWFG